MNDDNKQKTGTALAGHFEILFGEDPMGFLRKKDAVNEVTPRCPDKEGRLNMIALPICPTVYGRARTILRLRPDG